MQLRARISARLRPPALVAVLLLASAGCSQSPVADPARTVESTQPVESAQRPSDSTPSSGASHAVTIMGAGDMGGDQQDAARQRI
jgi:hypothetical protein